MDYAIRVVLRRFEVVRGAEQSKAVQTTIETAAKQTASSDTVGWRLMRVRPFIYPAAPKAQVITDSQARYFLITSQGLAASAWLASSLNLHTEITCAMGIDHSLVSMCYYYNDDRIRKRTSNPRSFSDYNKDEIQQKTDSIRNFSDIRHGFYSEPLRAHFRKRFAELSVPIETDLVRANPVRQLQHMYDELEWFEPRSKHFGNVHVCFAQQALEYLKDYPTQHDVALMNLIRHPVPRTEAAIKGVLSIATHVQDSDWQKDIDVNKFAETFPGRRDIEKRFGVDFTELRNRAVLYSYYRALHNDCWAGEITTVRETCHVTIERLMNERDYFSWLVREITRGEALATPEYLDKVFSEEHLQSGRHTGRGRSPGPRETYEGWTDWEKYEFSLAMERLKLPDVYAPFGYDLSFVK